MKRDLPLHVDETLFRLLGVLEQLDPEGLKRAFFKLVKGELDMPDNKPPVKTVTAPATARVADVPRPGPDTLIDVTDAVRVEQGPNRGRGKPTPDLMKRLAAHYKIGGIDSMGKKIVEGQDFDYIDWPGEKVWYLYKKDKDGRYQKQAYYKTKDEALAAANKVK